MNLDHKFYFYVFNKNIQAVLRVPTATASVMARQSVAESERNAPKSISVTVSSVAPDLRSGLTARSDMATTGMPLARAISANSSVSAE